MNKTIRKRRDLEDADEEVDPFAGGAGFQSDDDDDCVKVEPAPEVKDEWESSPPKDVFLGPSMDTASKHVDGDHQSTGDQGSEQPTVSSEHGGRSEEIEILPGHPTFVPRGGRYFLHEDRIGGTSHTNTEDPDLIPETVSYRFRADEIEIGKTDTVELVRKELLDVDDQDRRPNGTAQPKWDHALFEALEQSPEPLQRGRGGYRGRGYNRSWGYRNYGGYRYRGQDGFPRRSFRGERPPPFYQKRLSETEGQELNRSSYEAHQQQDNDYRPAERNDNERTQYIQPGRYGRGNRHSQHDNQYHVKNDRYRQHDDLADRQGGYRYQRRDDRGDYDRHDDYQYSRSQQYTSYDRQQGDGYRGRPRRARGGGYRPRAPAVRVAE